MPPKELPEAWADLKQALWEVLEPPLRWLLEKTQRR
jgi:hypothetical protein